MASEQPKGFNLACIKCGETACVMINTDDLETLRCQECENEFTMSEVEDIIDSYKAFGQWLETSREFFVKKA